MEHVLIWTKASDCRYCTYWLVKEFRRSECQPSSERLLIVTSEESVVLELPLAVRFLPSWLSERRLRMLVPELWRDRCNKERKSAKNLSLAYWDLGPISTHLWAHNSNLLKFFLLYFAFAWSNQVTNLYMPWQLSCRGMWKFVTWSDNYFLINISK